VPGPYPKDPGRTRYRSADYGSAGYGGAGRAAAGRGGAAYEGPGGGSRGAGRPGGPGDAYRDRPAPRPGGDGPARRPAAAADYQPRGSAGGGGRHGGGRGRSDWDQDPRDGGRPDSRYRGGGAPGGRGPRGGARPERGNGQVAQDLRERLGVNGSRGAGPAGGADDWDGRRGRGSRTAVGYADEGYSQRGPRSRRGPDDPGQDPGSRGRRGRGGRGGGRDGGPGGPRRRRSLGEWFKSGDWWRRWTWKKVFGLLATGCLLLILLVAGAFLYAYESITMPTDVAAAALSQPSTVYYSDGKPMASFSGNGVSHVILQSSQIPKVMDQAITAAEDRSFYTEGGISVTGLMRAVYEDLKGGSYLQGGSTLTEQFVKNYYTGFSSTGNTDKTLTDKLKQVIVAIKLAHLKSKSWIITNYLNTVPFGPQATGVGAAAETYFSEPASKLTVPQAAMLAALVNAPGVFNPDPNAGAEYTALVARWQYVLYNMYRDGNITLPEFTNLTGCASTGITSCPTKSKNFPKEHLHYVTAWNGPVGYLMNMVEQELSSTYHLGQTKLDNGGLKIHTTFSSSMMNGLTRAIRLGKTQMRQDGHGLPWYAHVGAVLVKPGTGAILAVYGGPGYGAKNCKLVLCDINMAEDPKQVGSSFKPYVLATAVSQGMNVQTSVLNGFSPIWIPEGPTLSDRMQLSLRRAPGPAETAIQPYLPFNEADENSGALTVSKAAAISSDPAFEDLAHRVGVQNVINMAKSLGVGQNPFNYAGVNDWQTMNAQFGNHSKLATGGSVAIALGESELTSVEQASMFATLADGGVFHTPHVVSKIVSPTGPIPLRVAATRVLSPSDAADVDYALSFDNVPGGTAYPEAAWPGRTVIAKTGTTQTAQDAWFIGAIPQYSLGVTLFTNKQDSVSSAGSQTLDILPQIGNNATGGYGGAWPARIWANFMTTRFASLPAAQLATPDYTGYAKWNQVGNLPKKHKKPNPKTSPPPHPGPTCTPLPFRPCQPGGSTSPPTTSSPPPTSSPPSPSCTPSPFQQCTSTTPSTGVSNAVANGMVYDEAPARKVSGGSTLVKALAVFLAAFF
jgi:membrane peptidoglycan carboxypeptidase